MTLLALAFTLALAQQPPVPRPFPQPGGSPPGRPTQPAPADQAPPRTAPSDPAPSQAATAPGVPTETTLGVPLYPGAQFLTSYDAGRGQRFYLFGTSATYVDLVAYYRTVLKQKGELVFDVPATHIFEIGRFREETMAFPPSVTVKDYQSELSAGYPNPKPGGQPARFPTLIQIVPVTDR